MFPQSQEIHTVELESLKRRVTRIENGHEYQIVVTMYLS